MYLYWLSRDFQTYFLVFATCFMFHVRLRLYFMICRQVWDYHENIW